VKTDPGSAKSMCCKGIGGEGEIRGRLQAASENVQHTVMVCRKGEHFTLLHVVCFGPGGGRNKKRRGEIEGFGAERA